MTLKILQNFYKATVTETWESGTGNRYVSVLPTPTSGRLVVNPSNTTKREIVEYDGIGTDGGGNYVTVITRGIGGTTDQDHDINEPVRMNVTAEDFADVQDELDDLQDEIDTLVLQNAPNASTTVKGISKLSAAPTDANDPIAVGTEDVKYQKIDDIPDTFVDTSAGAADEGKGVKLNAGGVLDDSFISQPLCGDESDGVLNVTSGTTNLDFASANILIKNYSSINISVGATLGATNPATNGSILVLRATGNVTIAGTIDLRLMGAAGGGQATEGTSAFYPFTRVNTPNGKATSFTTTGGAGGIIDNAFMFTKVARPVYGSVCVMPGSGGGGGSEADNSGGRGGGAIIIVCGGKLIFTGTINTSGQVGGEGVGAGKAGCGGGSAGMGVIYYNNVTTNTGTFTATGGNGGGSATTGSRGGGGGAASAVANGGAGGNDGSNGANAAGVGAGGGGAGTDIKAGGTGGATLALILEKI